MKTNRVLIVVVCLLVVLLAYLALSGRIKFAGETAQERWYTNNVEMWQTNIVEKWHTNSVETWRTNAMAASPTVITNEVVKEVPAKLSPLIRQAATAGYKYMNAPSFAEGSAAFYKASPLAVDVYVEPGATNIVREDATAIRDRINLDLTARGIPVADKSPYHLSVNVAKIWSADMPRVAVIKVRVELRESVASQRQGDVIGCAAVVWSTAASKLVRPGYAAEEVKPALQDPLDKFCNDYLQVKEKEKALESLMPALPPELTEEAK